MARNKKRALYGYKAATVIHGKPVLLWLAVHPPTDPQEFVLLRFEGKTRTATTSWEPSYESRPAGSIQASRLGRWGGFSGG